MPLEMKEIACNAREFANAHANDTVEEKDSQLWINDFFLKLFHVDINEMKSKSKKQEEREADMEYKVKMPDGSNGYIDFLWKGKIGIEMKTAGKSIDAAMNQLSLYVASLPIEDSPEILMASDMRTIRIFHRKSQVQAEFPVTELCNNVTHFSLIAGYEELEVFTTNEHEVSVQSVETLGKMYNEFEEKKYTGHSLELFLLRIVFCAFCEDTNLFDPMEFINYVHPQNKEGINFVMRLNQLFEVLDLPSDQRDDYLEAYSKDALHFPYVNGGLFHERLDRTPPATKGMQENIINLCKLDWQNVSPSVFGSMFQSISDKEKRRALGEHYTSEENILKVIKPLFLDSLYEEFEKSKYDKNLLSQLQNKLASLHFLDPACGCGNFLIVSYRELRILEMKIVAKLTEYQGRKPDASDFKVKLSQFHGIEINGFPCEIAKAAMWMTEHQMNRKAQELLSAQNLKTIFPLTDTVDIINGNALRIEWLDSIKGGKVDYIMGNPPFLGARVMSKEQKEELLNIFKDVKNSGNLDYVCCWYKKSAEIMSKNTWIRSAFVSTNSISQGEQVAILWKELKKMGMHIDFAYRSFKWGNDAKGKATVHCVIVGFSCEESARKRLIFEDGSDAPIIAKNINGYLVDADDVFIESRTKPLCDVPEIGIGNKPIDGGNYLFTEEEKNEFIEEEKGSEKYFRTWLGAEEFIYGKNRYCLWLGDIEPKELKNLPLCKARVDAVRQYRLASKSEPTRRLAEKPRNFHVENMPEADYIVIPRVSSDQRFYIPIGFIDKGVIASDATHIIPNATHYHFAILTSSVHMAWVRAVCGRLGNGYRYSKDIVYNNFHWPENVTDDQKKNLENLAQAILDARDAHPNSTLSDLYDPNSMPDDLRDAHNKLDKAVLKLYGFEKNKKAGRDADFTEPQIVAKLMEKYQELVSKQ